MSDPIATLLIAAVSVGYGWIWGKGWNPRLVVERDRNAKLGAWLRERVSGAVKHLLFCGADCTVTNRTIWTMDGQDVEITIRVGGDIEPLAKVVAEHRI